jgi:hypothetical protein
MSGECLANVFRYFFVNIFFMKYSWTFVGLNFFLLLYLMSDNRFTQAYLDHKAEQVVRSIGMPRDNRFECLRSPDYPPSRGGGLMQRADTRERDTRERDTRERDTRERDTRERDTRERDTPVRSRREPYISVNSRMKFYRKEEGGVDTGKSSSSRSQKAVNIHSHVQFPGLTAASDATTVVSPVVPEAKITVLSYNGASVKRSYATGLDELRQGDDGIIAVNKGNYNKWSDCIKPETTSQFYRRRGGELIPIFGESEVRAEVRAEAGHSHEKIEVIPLQNNLH